MVHPSLRIPYPSHLRKFQPNALMAQQPLMESFSILSLSSRVLPPIYSAKASHAQLPDMPLRRDQARPSPYREYSSYPAKEKSAILVKKKVPSHSGFSLSTHVVLKTRHVIQISTYVDIRATYVAQTYLPLVHNFLPLRGATT